MALSSVTVAFSSVAATIEKVLAVVPVKFFLSVAVSVIVGAPLVAVAAATLVLEA